MPNKMDKVELRIDFKKLSIAAFGFGFILIAVHELGDEICDWLTGHPATMSYARDRLLAHSVISRQRAALAPSGPKPHSLRDRRVGSLSENLAASPSGCSRKSAGCGPRAGTKS